MVHELIGIQDNKVDLRKIGKSSQDQQVVFQFYVFNLPFYFIFQCIVKIEISACYSCFQEVVLSSEQDAFFKANMYENFGDIGMNIKKMVDDFQQIAKSNQNIQTIGLPSVKCAVFLCTVLYFWNWFKNVDAFELVQRIWLNSLTTIQNIKKCMAMFLST